MFSFFAGLVLSVSSAFSSAPAAPACETYAPRLDGTVVTVCSGSVVRVCDQAGNCNERPYSSR
jgi:hypothetical protein